MIKLLNGFPNGRTGIGLLLIRLIVGAAFINHGLFKIENPFGWMGPHAPVPGFLQAAAAVAEFGGGFALILGLVFPIAALGILATMSVAILTVHIPMHTPWIAMKGDTAETAVFYWFIALALLFTGPGAYSLDAFLFGDRFKARSETPINRTVTA